MNQETDRELLELVAKAAGRDVLWKRGMHRGEPHEGLYDNKTGHVTSWNPLTDDGDALRLAVTLKLEIMVRADGVWVCADNVAEFFQPADGDLFAATRRAIVRAAAEIGRTLTESA